MKKLLGIWVPKEDRPWHPQHQHRLLRCTNLPNLRHWECDCLYQSKVVLDMRNFQKWFDELFLNPVSKIQCHIYCRHSKESRTPLCWCSVVNLITIARSKSSFPEVFAWIRWSQCTEDGTIVLGRPLEMNCIKAI